MGSSIHAETKPKRQSFIEGDPVRHPQTGEESTFVKAQGLDEAVIRNADGTEETVKLPLTFIDGFDPGPPLEGE